MFLVNESMNRMIALERDYRGRQGTENLLIANENKCCDVESFTINLAIRWRDAEKGFAFDFSVFDDFPQYWDHRREIVLVAPTHHVRTLKLVARQFSGVPRTR